MSSILASLGLAGAAVALAAKESIENLIASFVIFFDKPFKSGDYVKVNAFAGTVEKIGLRSTRIRTDQKTFVTVPNKQMVDSVVDNLTLRTQRKGELRLELGLSTGPAQLDLLIAGIKGILVKDKVENSTAFLNDITGSAYLINVDYFYFADHPGRIQCRQTAGQSGCAQADGKDGAEYRRVQHGRSRYESDPRRGAAELRLADNIPYFFLPLSVLPVFDYPADLLSSF
ncbi:mechanosensitive ion channel family protein [Puia sp. P3]|uniref:mechanosensitive ion channel family protein n=1 Tax=Puia sp. P3 TaxID=3423952 RepID=UPI003D672C50